MKKATLADVAQLAQVSKATVSRYLKKENVRADIAERIEAALKESGYVAKGEAGKKTAEEAKLHSAVEKTVCDIHQQPCFAIFSNDLSSARTRRILSSLQQVLYQKQALFQLYLSSRDASVEKQHVQMCIREQVDGVFVEHCEDAAYLEEAFSSAQIPVLYLQEQQEGKSFLMDEERAGELLGAYLLERKCLSMKYIGCEEQRAMQRIAGIKKSYHKEHQPLDVTFTKCDGTYTDTYEKIKEIFAEKSDLLLLEQEEYAIALSRFAKEYHITIPENVSVAAFCGYDLANVMSPALTCVSVDYAVYAQGAYAAMRALMKKQALPEREELYTLKKGSSVR